MNRTSLLFGFLDSKSSSPLQTFLWAYVHTGVFFFLWSFSGVLIAEISASLVVNFLFLFCYLTDFPLPSQYRRCVLMGPKFCSFFMNCLPCPPSFAGHPAAFLSSPHLGSSQALLFMLWPCQATLQFFLFTFLYVYLRLSVFFLISPGFYTSADWHTLPFLFSPTDLWASTPKYETLPV